MDFVGDMSNILLEREVRGLSAMSEAINRADRQDWNPLSNHLVTTPLSAAALPARASNGVQGEGNDLAIGSPWVDGGGVYGECSLPVKQQQCARCGEYSAVCTKCALRVVNWTLTTNFETYSSHSRRPKCSSGRDERFMRQ